MHNEELELFRVGRTVGAGVRRFVENGDSEIMEQEQEQTLRQLYNFTFKPKLEPTICMNGSIFKGSVLANNHFVCNTFS